MGRPFSVEHIVLADGAEDPRFEPGAMPEKEFFGSLHPPLKAASKKRIPPGYILFLNTP